MLASKILLTKPIVENNIFQIIVSGYAATIFALGIPIVFNVRPTCLAPCPSHALNHISLGRQRRKTLLQIFILLASLALLLNIIAWIIILMQTSKMSLYEALCDTPGDCPKYFNPNYVIGIVVSAVYAVLVREASIGHEISQAKQGHHTRSSVFSMDSS